MISSPEVLGSGTALDLIPLPLLRPGQRARVEEVVGLSDLVHRLREMGLRKGVEVEMIRPGSPCLVRLNGLKIGLRADELAGVLVSPPMSVRR